MFVYLSFTLFTALCYTMLQSSFYYSFRFLFSAGLITGEKEVSFLKDVENAVKLL